MINHTRCKFIVIAASSLLILIGFAYAQEKEESLVENIQTKRKREMLIEMTLEELSRERTKNIVETEKPDLQNIPDSSLLSKLGLKEKLFGLHGYLETRNYYHLHKNNDDYFYYQLRNNFRLSKELTLSPKLHSMTSLDGSLFYFQNDHDGLERKEARLDPWEIYLDYYKDKFDIRLGQQIIRWGKSDEINPTDVFTPEDLSEFFNNVERAKRKIPSFATKFDYYHNDCSLEVIWLPFFKKTRLDETGGNWEPYLSRAYREKGLQFLDDDEPSRKIEHSNLAAKIKKEGENSDISLSYSYHYAQTPALEVNPLLAQVKPVYPRQHTIGSDFETVIGRWGLRGETAFTTNYPFVSYDPKVTNLTVYKDALNYVLGADYTLLNGLYINLQYAQQYIFDYPGNLATQKTEDSIIWRISQNLKHETITLKTTGRYYLSCRDLVFESSLLYKLTDNLNFTLGFYLFEGEEEGIFGQYKKNDQIFSRLKYSF